MNPFGMRARSGIVIGEAKPVARTELDGDAILKALDEISGLLNEEGEDRSPQAGPIAPDHASPPASARAQPAEFDPAMVRVLFDRAATILDDDLPKPAPQPAPVARDRPGIESPAPLAIASQQPGEGVPLGAFPSLSIPEPRSGVETRPRPVDPPAAPSPPPPQKRTRIHQHLALVIPVGILFGAVAVWETRNEPLFVSAKEAVLPQVQELRTWLAAARERVAEVLPRRTVEPSAPIASSPPSRAPAATEAARARNLGEAGPGNGSAPAAALSPPASPIPPPSQVQISAGASEPPAPLTVNPPEERIQATRQTDPLPSAVIKAPESAPTTSVAVLAPPAPAAMDAPPARPAVPSLSAEAIDALMARGDALLATGDVVSARLFYERAAEAGAGRAALAMAESYDSQILSLAGIRGVRGNPAEAAAWYRRARELGDYIAGSSVPSK